MWSRASSNFLALPPKVRLRSNSTPRHIGKLVPAARDRVSQPRCCQVEDEGPSRGAGDPGDMSRRTVLTASMVGPQVIWASACLLALAQSTAAAALVEEAPSLLQDYHEPDELFDLVHGYGVDKKDATFRTVKGLFLQEDADKALESPGQHENFGALKSWDHIHSLLDHDTKLLFLIRHGEAWSNRVQAEVGDKAWKKGIGSQCTFFNRSSGETNDLFDPVLTPEGSKQASDLNAVLTGSDGWLKTLAGGFEYDVIVSPLRRCLDTALLVFDKVVEEKDLHVSEYVRERMGVETCDARRGLSSPHHDSALEDAVNEVGVLGDVVDEDEVDRKHKKHKKRKHRVNCDYKKGLRKLYPGISFPIVEGDEGFGLVADEDVLWEADYRETKNEVADRLENFLRVLYRTTTRKVVFVILHSGSTRGVLEAVGREAYRPQNAEVVPVIVERVERVPAAV